MRALWEVDGARWTLRLRLHPEDPVRGKGQEIGQGDENLVVGLMTDHCTVELPFAVEDPHPDLEALAALLIVVPWTARRLVLRRAVSTQLADAVREQLDIELLPVDPALTPRAAGDQVVLSYSAGADSTAASLVLPEGTPHLHLRRVGHPNVPNRHRHVRPDAFERVARIVGERGRDVQVVRQNIEHLCNPYPTLPHRLTWSIGPLLTADHYGAGTVALGITLDTVHVSNGRKWSEEAWPYSNLDALAEAVGMPVMQPVAPMSEVGTLKVALDSDLADAIRYCAYGTADTQCHRCVKCVRKDLLIAALRGEEVPDTIRALSPDDRAIHAVSYGPPFVQQAQLEFALARVDVSGTALEPLARKLAPRAEDTEWMLRAYAGSAAQIPKPWRDDVMRRTDELLGMMTPADEAQLKAWDLNARTYSSDVA